MDIDRSYFSGLTELVYESAAKARAKKKGLALSRKLFSDGDTVVKAWPQRSTVWNSVYVAGKLEKFHPLKALKDKPTLPIFASGLMNEGLCPAFVDHIYENSILVGYATRKGAPLTEGEIAQADVQRFISTLIDQTLSSGYVYRDLHGGNLIRLPDGRISLIDLETPVARLEDLDLDEEIQTGALRRGILRPYRRFILNRFDRRVSDLTPVQQAIFQTPQNLSTPLEEYEPISRVPIDAWIARVERALAEIRGGVKADATNKVAATPNVSDINAWIEIKEAELERLKNPQVSA